MASEVFDPVLDASWKGYPGSQPPRRLGEVGASGWNVLAGDLPLPLAVLRRAALSHNIDWMQRFARSRGIDLAPHGKTTMSPQLFARQLEAGAWGITFATVAQLVVGISAGVRNAMIANQVMQRDDLALVRRLLAETPGLRILFFIDSRRQLTLIEDAMPMTAGEQPFEVLIEIGVDGGRAGTRTTAEALDLARALNASPAVRLVGVACYEGLGATGEDDADRGYADALMGRVQAVVQGAVAEALFEGDEVICSAGGSALFDLVAGWLRPSIDRPVRGLLRSGCYVTHDHGFYRRLVNAVDRRMGCRCDEGLRPALEVWTAVQSRPEPGLAILTVGRRDISFDQALPVPIARAALASPVAVGVPASWQVTGLNDQHAYLRWDPADENQAPAVGDRVGLGISHPCTTFDKWRWMPVVDDDYRVVDAVATRF